jgi:hypothetical protein
MSPRRAGAKLDPELVRSVNACRATAAAVEEAKAVLLLGVPSGRAARLPLAEALFGFEEGLAEARGHLSAWRRPEATSVWEACAAALDEATARAERLRLEPTTEAYEALVPSLDALLDPLQVFADAEVAFVAEVVASSGLTP